ncbi:hypothetical protein ABZZ20_36120 [Streptomyces sp. NPDC006430]|uniref:hypothetical protein n=1 Tax=Streptomyces sp. NPDC006430 TaxID=3154299 RepID=UPI0033B7B945
MTTTPPTSCAGTPPAASEESSDATPTAAAAPPPQVYWAPAVWLQAPCAPTPACHQQRGRNAAVVVIVVLSCALLLSLGALYTLATGRTAGGALSGAGTGHNCRRTTAPPMVPPDDSPWPVSVRGRITARVSH